MSAGPTLGSLWLGRAASSKGAPRGECRRRRMLQSASLGAGWILADCAKYEESLVASCLAGWPGPSLASRPCFPILGREMSGSVGGGTQGTRSTRTSGEKCILDVGMCAPVQRPVGENCDSGGSALKLPQPPPYFVPHIASSAGESGDSSAYPFNLVNIPLATLCSVPHLMCNILRALYFFELRHWHSPAILYFFVLYLVIDHSVNFLFF